MPKFLYKAKKSLDQDLEGTIEAENQDEALNKLVEQGLFPISLEPQIILPEKIAPRQKTLFIFRKGITSGDILVFTQKLSTLIRAKVDLLSALRILYEQTEHTRFKEIILAIHNATKEGKAFSESLEKFPNVFPSLYINIIKAGEASGRLDSALEQISEFLSRQQNLKTRVSVALAYPILLVLVGLVSIFVLINFVIPRLKPIFEGLGRELPLITKIILKVSMLSGKIWWIVLGVIAFLILILYHQKGGPFFNHLIRKLKTNLPILKRLAKNQELDLFSRSLSLLLKSGVIALTSLEISISGIEDPKLREELKRVCQDVASGQAISKSMKNLTGLPNFFTKMVAVGEESGRLAEVLDEISRSYLQQIEADIAIITSLIEPLLILVLGGILGGIVLSILLPTFQITQMVH